MAAKTTDVSNASTLIANLYTQGAQVVAQPILSIDSPNKVDQEAFSLAMKDANSQAIKMGLTNWKLFKKIVAITQVTSPATSTSTTTPNKNDLTAPNNGVFRVVKTVSVTYKMW